MAPQATYTPLDDETVTQIAIGLAFVLILAGVLSAVGAAHIVAAPANVIGSGAAHVQRAIGSE